jgi:hypothetical protein
MRKAWHPGAVVAALLTVAAVLSGALAGCSSTAAGHHTAAGAKHESTYGSLPSFLPKQSIQADSVLTGSVQRPALTVQGDAVRVGTGGPAVLITVTGPQVPGEGLPYQTSATTCTWIVTITTGSAPEPIDPHDFSSTDHLGAVTTPAFVPGQPTPPAVAAAHTTTTFELRAVMVVGEGLMRWAPDGKHPVAAWDFEVEND